jgi:hypothetical protein
MSQGNVLSFASQSTDIMERPSTSNISIYKVNYMGGSMQLLARQQNPLEEDGTESQNSIMKTMNNRHCSAVICKTKKVM